MKYYEKKEIKTVENTLTKVTCDICKKEIEDCKKYYHVETHNSAWGNDNKDICSNECLKKEMEEYLNDDNEGKYIEIEEEINYIK